MYYYRERGLLVRFVFVCRFARLLTIVIFTLLGPFLSFESLLRFFGGVVSDQDYLVRGISFLLLILAVTS